MINELEEKLDSPCVRNCCLDENDICLGCYRTLSEITLWTSMSKEEQQVVLDNAKHRAEESGNNDYT